MEKERVMAKKTSPWVWVAGGCGCLVVVILAVFVGGGLFVAKKAGEIAEDFEKNPGLAALKLAVQVNPELEIGEIDEANETVTIRNTKTGEEVTMSFQDIEEGKFTMITEDGETTINFEDTGAGGGVTVTKDGEETFQLGAGAEAGEWPEWIPRYPDAGVGEGGFTSQMPEATAGMRMLTTGDAYKGVVDWYQQELEGAGFAVTRTVTETADGGYGSLSVNDETSGRTLTVVVLAAEGGGSTIQIQFSEEK
jgi:hypothetical protein